MNHWIWLVSLVGILSTAVVLGTDMFFLTSGRAALRMASLSVGTEIVVFFHLFADARMPIWASRRSCPTSCCPCSAAHCVPACPVPRVASRSRVNVAGALPFEESGAPINAHLVSA